MNAIPANILPARLAEALDLAETYRARMNYSAGKARKCLVASARHTRRGCDMAASAMRGDAEQHMLTAMRWAKLLRVYQSAAERLS